MEAVAGSLVFKMVSSPEPAGDYLAQLIKSRLEKAERVLWLVPGGSAMEAAILAAGRLRGTPNLDNLTVTLTDERYGPPGHRDSNWHQLMAGGFDLPGAGLQPVLEGKDLDQTASDYNRLLDRQLKNSDFSVALAGMGPDGHIFGILPDSPAIDSGRLAAGYKWQDYTRLTATPRLLKKLDEVVIYALGEPKWPQITKLETDSPPAEQPAQFLKKLKRVTFFNDYQGEES